MGKLKRAFLSVGLAGLLAVGSGCGVEKKLICPEVRLPGSKKFDLNYQPRTLQEIVTYNNDNVLYVDDLKVAGVMDYWTSPGVMMEKANASVSKKIEEDCDGVSLFNCALAEFKQLDYFPEGFVAKEKGYPPSMLILISESNKGHAVSLLKKKTWNGMKYGMVDQIRGLYPIYDSISDMIIEMNRLRRRNNSKKELWVEYLEIDLSPEDYWKFSRRNLFPELFQGALDKKNGK